MMLFCSFNYGQTALPTTKTQLAIEYMAVAFLSIGLGILITLSKYKKL